MGRSGACMCRRVSPPDITCSWVDWARVEGREKPGLTIAEREEIKALRKKVVALKRANEILKTVSAFSEAAELDRRPN